MRRHHQLPLASDFGEVAQAIREAERSLQDLSKARTQLGNRLHLQLSDTYTAAYEEYFGKLRSPLALRFFRRLPLPQELLGHNVEMLASLLLDLADIIGDPLDIFPQIRPRGTCRAGPVPPLRPAHFLASASFHLTPCPWPIAALRVTAVARLRGQFQSDLLEGAYDIEPRFA